MNNNDYPSGWVRYRVGGRGPVALGVRRGDGTVVAAPAVKVASVAELVAREDLPDLTAQLASRPATLAVDEVELLPPLDPGARVFCVAKNYHAHAEEMGSRAPEAPSFFTRHAGSLVGHGQPLVRPLLSRQHDFEGELAVVIGRPGRHLSADEALAHVGAYSCFNDGSIRDFQRHSYTAGKNFDASGAMGPALVPAAGVADPQALALTTLLNDEAVQEDGTALMVHPVAALLAYLSGVTALRSGDVIATGTPKGVGAARRPPLWMQAGDRVSVLIGGVGALHNVVVDEA